MTIKSLQKRFRQVFPNKKMPTASEIVEAILASYAQAYLQVPLSSSDNDIREAGSPPDSSVTEGMDIP